MLTKTFISLSVAAALSSAALPSLAASSFYLVVPMPLSERSQAPAPDDVAVQLNSGALPDAKIGNAYSQSLAGFLLVTGDPTYSVSKVSWRVVEGNLPAGLTLDPASGLIAGTPTIKNDTGASFEVLASYKGKDGQAVYTIKVGGQILKVRSLVSSYFHTCAITTTGAAKCWGENSYGQLGDNSTTKRLVPVDVQGLGSGVASMAAGYYHTCAVTTAGAAKCWGFNEYGQLGDNSVTQSLVPVDVVGLGSTVKTMSAGEFHTCAVTIAGAAKCWGFNAYGQLGDTTTAQRKVPVNVQDLGSGVATITVGEFHTCAVTAAGAAKCWGENSFGQLGDNSTTKRLVPVDVQGLGTEVAAITAGAYHTCAVTTSGAAKCWGYNSYGQLGDNSATKRLLPVDVRGLGSGVVTIAAGGYHNCAVTISGTAKCWGRNDSGQLGDNTTTTRMVPSPVQDLGTGVDSMVAGFNHTCAVTTAGEAKCWGANNSGQLGDNSTTQRPTPVSVHP